MKKIIIVIVSACVVLIALSAVALGSGEISMDNRLGQLFRNANEGVTTNVASDVAVKFRDHELTVGEVEYTRDVNAVLSGTSESLVETARKMMTNYLMIFEAQELGISATQEEIDALVNNTRQTYELPDGKAMMDEFLTSAGISLEEYMEAIEAQAPNTITRQKLKNYYGELWCEENGVEFTNVNPPQGMMDYIDEMLDGIYEKYEDEIIYYIGDSLA